ncbi:FGGY family carbohydrate kinase [Paraburkholderia phenoliruptrix]|uniref:ATP:glycerol 3-phosphotransferase n=2 Tax=Paraburkholderia phenoliruptrix TaxID=252970 RepID=K0DRQ6_9BURK|nr:FGGY family carbohydrate kinase [Paraburkholderia phenoliruptrix]AFT86109.1 glycerol kinase [Paraburkholderia phenoliruptrix BR3459a]CAB4048657.1 Glycerol kinase [Paraburkholderia phenoliruptrix]
MRIAAIDQGTTSTRVLVADSNGGADIVHSVRHRQHHPQPGWVEHSPEELLSNLNACIEAAGTIDAIGIDNQGESCLAWDAESGEALSPVIVWQDNRTAELLKNLRQEGAEELTLSRAGLPLDPYFSASKLAWLLQHNDRVKAARRAGTLRLGTTDAYFLDCLTGHFATDTTTASRTSLMNLEKGEWDEDLCRLFGVPVECLPEIRPTVGEFGSVGTIPVTASIVDQQAALYGHGCRKTGDAKVTFGTGAFALALTGNQIVRAPEQGLLPTVAWRIGNEITYALDGGVYDASSAVEWAGRLGLFADLSEISTFETPPAIMQGLAFVPALSGLACPHWDRGAGALWVGMCASTTKSDLCQALLEGIALCTSEVIAAMMDRVNVTDRLSIDGGLGRNVYFVQFLADVLERTIVTQRFHELTAFGCAALASMGLGSALPEYRNASTAFHPRQDKATVGEWKVRFAEAVTRSKGWR